MYSPTGSVATPAVRPQPCRAATFAALVTVLLGGSGAAAHPHVFIDGGLDFVFDGNGRIESLRVTWIYDPLTSLFMLEDLGIASTGPLDAADRDRLAAYQTEWVPAFEGDSYLRHQGRDVGLSGPLDPEAEIRDGLVVIRFLRDLAAPVRPGNDTVAEVYDPTYFTAYRITEVPVLENAPSACAAEVKPFEPTRGLAALQKRLLAIPVESTPEDADVGALFAEKIHLRCD